ncbi:condensation domain-containing protein, partial [Rheinheimera gaetbuli]
MINVTNLIKDLKKKGVKVGVKDNTELVIRGARENLTPELIAQIKTSKLALINVLREKSGKSFNSDILKADRTARLPLSYSQKRLWFLDQIDGASAQYNIPCALELTGKLDQEALFKAFNTIVNRHEILRTRFAKDEQDKPYQVIQPYSSLNIDVLDFSLLKEMALEASIREQIRKEAEADFDLSVDLMLRVTLIKKAQQVHILLVTLHHIAADGWSMEILLREFSALYQAFTQGQPNTLPELTVQYADFAIWQKEGLVGDTLNQSLFYWQGKLDGIDPVHGVPLDGVRSAQRDYQGGVFLQVIDSTLLDKLDELAQQQEVTRFMLLETCLALLISLHSQKQDVVIGSPISVRCHPKLEPLIGFFINNLALRTQCLPGMSFIDLLQQNKCSILDAFEHQNVPFDLLVEKLNPIRNLNHEPIFQIVFGLNETAQMNFTIPGLNVEVLSQEGTKAKVDLELAVTPISDGLQVNWTYDTSLFAKESISHLAASYIELLRCICTQPESDIHQLSLSCPEQQSTLKQWSSGGASLATAQEHWLCAFERHAELSA